MKMNINSILRKICYHIPLNTFIFITFIFSVVFTYIIEIVFEKIDFKYNISKMLKGTETYLVAYLTVFGVIFASFIPAAFITSWDGVLKLSDTIIDEIQACAEIYKHSENFATDEQFKKMKLLVKNFLISARDYELDSLGEFDIESLDTKQKLKDLHDYIKELKTNDEYYLKAYDSLHELNVTRFKKIERASDSFPISIWVVVIFLIILTLFFFTILYTSNKFIRVISFFSNCFILISFLDILIYSQFQISGKMINFKNQYTYSINKIDP